MQCDYSLLINNDTYPVLALQSPRWQFDGLQPITVVLQTQTPLTLTATTQAQLLYNNTPYQYGLITASQCDASAGVYNTTLTLNSPWAALNSIHTRSFVAKTLPDIVTAVVANTALDSVPINWQLKRPTPRLAMALQQQQTDAEFLSQLLTDAGLCWTFQAANTGPILYITDDIREHPGTAHTLDTAQLKPRQQRRHSTAELELRSAARDNPHVVHRAKGTVAAGYGLTRQQGLVFNNNAEAQQRLQQTQAAQVAARGQRCWHTGALQVRLGDSVSTDGQTWFRVIGIAHQFDRRQGQAVPQGTPALQTRHGTNHRLTLLPMEQPYALPHQQNTVASHVFASVDSRHGDKPDVDEQGRYHVVYEGDESLHANGAGSMPMAMAQASSGYNSGHHFPLTPGQALVIGAGTGQLLRPLLLGSVATAQTPSVVSATNPTEHHWQSVAGQALQMNDAKTDSRMSFTTQHANQSLHFIHADTPQTTLSSHTGKLYAYSGQTLQMRSAVASQLHAGGEHHVTSGGAYQLSTQHGDIGYDSGASLGASAQQSLALTSAKALTLKSHATHTLHSKTGQTLSSDGLLTLRTEHGTLTLAASQGVTLNAAGGFTLAQAKANVSLDKSGNLTVQASTLEVQVPKLTVNGAKVKKLTPGQAASATHITRSQHLQHYWLTLNYLTIDPNVKPPAQRFTLSTRSSQAQQKQDIQQYSGKINPQGYGGTDLLKDKIPSHLILSQSDIIAINGKSSGYPSTHTTLTPSDWQPANGKGLSPETAQPGDKQLSLTTLFPPIIKNLRRDAPLGTDVQLSNDELAYFKNNGNNAMVFIHGYNVPLGQFPYIIDALDCEADGLDYIKTAIDYTAHRRSYYCDLDVLKQRFPNAKEVLDPTSENFPEALQVAPTCEHDTLNGEGAHNWFIRMEDNLNRATNQFDHTDYTQYTRCIHIAWQGDCGELNYVSATKEADAAAEKLTAILRQLHDKGIKTNIVAHSLGNRLLLGALDKAPAESVEHIFLWEPAVSELALSSTPEKDTSLIPHAFPQAMNAVKKVTVLYNEYDTILAVPYWLASYFGVDLGDKLNALLLNLQKADSDSLWVSWQQLNQPPSVFDTFKSALIATCSTGAPEVFKRIKAVCDDREFDTMMGHWLDAMTSKNDDTVREKMKVVNPILTRYASQFGCAQALGLHGLENNLSLQNELASKYVPAPMSKWATGHSYMHVPTAAVMKHGYMKWVINQTNGVNSFGNYSESQFTKD